MVSDGNRGGKAGGEGSRLDVAARLKSPGTLPPAFPQVIDSPRFLIFRIMAGFAALLWLRGEDSYAT